MAEPTTLPRGVECRMIEPGWLTWRQLSCGACEECTAGMTAWCRQPDLSHGWGAPIPTRVQHAEAAEMAACILDFLTTLGDEAAVVLLMTGSAHSGEAAALITSCGTPCRAEHEPRPSADTVAWLAQQSRFGRPDLLVGDRRDADAYARWVARSGAVGLLGTAHEAPKVDTLAWREVTVLPLRHPEAHLRRLR